MKVWPIDPLVPRNLRLEVPEKLPQGLVQFKVLLTVPGSAPQRSLVRSSPYCAGDGLERRTALSARLLGDTPGCGDTSRGSRYQALAATLLRGIRLGRMGKNSRNRGNLQLTWLLCFCAIAKRFNAR